MLLSVRNLTVEYAAGSRTPVRTVCDASLDIPESSVVGLLGESGCGKSTLALAILGLTKGSGRITGSVRLREQELLALSEAAWRNYRGREIGLITQNPRASLNPVKRIGDQLVQRCRLYGAGSMREARHQAVTLLEQVGINDPEQRMRAFPHELSGGMAQRVIIAMALSSAPALLIADEPTTALDVTIQAQILDLLMALQRSRGLSVLLISHDIGVIAQQCDVVYVMNSGEIVEMAGIDQFFEHPYHPASIALLAAQRDPDHYAAVRLHGLPVDARNPPEGCRLHERCPFASPGSGCHNELPLMRQIAVDRYVRCHRVEHVPELVAAATRDMYAGTDL